MSKPISIATESQMIESGQSFSYGLQAGDTVHLSGDLGVGKTTFVRGVITGLGYSGPVLSPTFSLVESYELRDFNVHHFDLYRLENEQELELIGFRDYFTKDNVIIIEWPDRAMELLGTPDYDIHIEQSGVRQLVINHRVNK